MMTTSKCVINFSSQYAYLSNKECVHVDDYTKLNENKIFFCEQGHELLYANGKKNKAHFRHKHSEDVGGNPMTYWHIEWQGNFPTTERPFRKKNDDDEQIKDRRCDVLLNETTIIEFQHSPIEYDEVINRTNDYKMHNKQIIWVIDGNENIVVNDENNRIYLEFTDKLWKFESFIECGFIYIDINSTIYKVEPSKIKSNMIDVCLPMKKEDFINCLIHNIQLFVEENPFQCNIFIKQQGAGNGKTFGIIKMIESDDFLHYTFFIYVSKQHSAINVIFNEFKEQTQHGNLLHIKLEGDTIPNIENKKYVIKYRNLKTNKDCKLIIGTIDSFMYSIGNKHHSERDKFEGLVKSIIHSEIQITKNGGIRYGGTGVNPRLYKETILIIDESQDLPIPYAEATISIMKQTYIDVYLVGDKLQSISHNENAFTHLFEKDEKESRFYKIIKPEFTNICRRFTHPLLIDFVNYMVPFNKYSLPEIQQNNSTSNSNPCCFFEGNSIYVNKKDGCTINEEVMKIMKYYEKEVEECNRLPEDFLIVTPFTQNNPLVDALQLAINIFWINKYENNERYDRYAIFHKSETGTSIDLTESEYSTRIVSIHSSKGDGRKVVFVIGLSEKALILFSCEPNNLIYDSLLHVAITRMKEKLYFRWERNGDDIDNKIQQYLYKTDNYEFRPRIDLSNSIDLSKIIKNNEDYRNFKENIFDNLTIEKIEEITDEKKIIDMSHHNIRHASIFVNLCLEIIRNEIKNKTENIKQIHTIFRLIIRDEYERCENWKAYNSFLQDYEVIILKISNKGPQYIKYYNIIIKFVDNIIGKIKNIICNKKGFHRFCPLECVILFYMMECKQNGKYTTFHISKLYDIIDIYNKSFTIEHSDHKKCLCNALLCSEITLNNGVNTLDKYICEHFEKIDIINKIYSKLFLKYPKISWNINHRVNYNGNSEYNLYKKFNLIGYDDNNVIIAYIKPQFNSLNYNECLMDAVFDTFLVKNVKYETTTDNYQKYNGKKIECVVFSTDLQEPYYIDFTNAETSENLINTNTLIIKESISRYAYLKYSIESKIIYNFYKYCRKNCSKIKPLEIIDDIIEEFEKEKSLFKENQNKYSSKEFPRCITEFFHKIKYSIEMEKTNKEKKTILNSYDEKSYFMEKLDETLKSSINRYFELCDDSDDDEYEELL